VVPEAAGLDRKKWAVPVGPGVEYRLAAVGPLLRYEKHPEGPVIADYLEPVTEAPVAAQTQPPELAELAARAAYRAAAAEAAGYAAAAANRVRQAGPVVPVLRAVLAYGRGRTRLAGFWFRIRGAFFPVVSAL
jgi:hypothetical protein